MNAGEIEELFKSEEFAKAVNKTALRNLFYHLDVMRNPNSTPEQKALAQENVARISSGKPTLKALKPEQAATPSVNKDKISSLEGAISGAEKKMADIYNKKTEQNISAVNNRNKNIKAEAAAAREKIKQDERQKNLLPGSDFTLQELQGHVARTARGPNDASEPDIKTKPTTPAQKAKIDFNRASSVIDKALGLAHNLHSNGDVDSAHNVLSQIPREHMPKELKHYDPIYVHYNVTPNLWKQLPAEHQEHVKNFHHEVMSGQHDNSPHEPTKAMVTKIKGIQKPS